MQGRRHERLLYAVRVALLDDDVDLGSKNVLVQVKMSIVAVEKIVRDERTQ